MQLLLFGVPQGSVLRPLLYVLYTAELFDVVARHRLRLHISCMLTTAKYVRQYASQQRRRRRCPPHSDINDWMKASRLHQNPAKTQIMWLGTGQQLDKITVRDVPVLSTEVSARNLGVIINSQLSLDAHVAAVCRSGYYQLRQLRPVTRSLSADADKTLVQAFISSRFYYCNALLYGVSLIHI